MNYDEKSNQEIGRNNEREDSWIKFQRSGRGDTLGWGLIFLWGMMVLIAELVGLTESISWWNRWAVFFLGFGIIALCGGYIGLQIGNRIKATWNFFIGIIMVGFSLGILVAYDLVTSDWAWVIVLGGIAVMLIILALSPNKNRLENTDISQRCSCPFSQFCPMGNRCPMEWFRNGSW